MTGPKKAGPSGPSNWMVGTPKLRVRFTRFWCSSTTRSQVVGSSIALSCSAGSSPMSSSAPRMTSGFLMSWTSSQVRLPTAW